jgi:hypothetical protein
MNQVQRARWHQNNFIFNVSTKNLHEIHSTKYRLLVIQLHKSGVLQFDPWTLAEIMGFKDKYGKPPDEAGDTIFERWMYFMGVKAQIQEEMVGGAGGGKQQGRPSSGHAGPKLAQKEGGARSTITESR